MKAFKKPGSTVLLIVTIFLTLIFLSEARAFPPPFKKGYFGSACSAIPNLTTEQISEIQKLEKAFIEETLPLRNELLKKRLELRTLWLSKDLDEGKILGLQKEIFDLKAKIEEKRIKLILEISKLLKPEQRALFRTFGRGHCRGF